jgi:hypothetical protein
MVRSFTLGLGALAVAATAGTAGAQQVGGAGPEIGTGDAARSSAATRDQQANYNRLIGNIDAPNAMPTGVKGKSKPAVVADLRAGSPLRDIAGVPIGRVALVAQDGVVVDTGRTKIKVPTVAFGKDDLGLLLGISAAKFGELVARAQSAR